MRKVQTDKAQLGAKLARDVFSRDGGILLSQGAELKESYIEKLKNYGITELFIDDDISAGVEITDVVRANTRRDGERLIRDMMASYSFSDTLEVENVKELVNEIINELMDNDDIIDNLSTIRSVDKYTFEHSVNVCILSLITGIGLGYDSNLLRDLGVGAILHDIGKLRISSEILQKPSQLTVEEFEEIKKHTVYGYEILKKNSDINIISSYIALGHHERFDGTGYPLQLKGENIQQCTRIVAVADVYDALTSDRVYRKKLKPNEVFEYITSLGSHHFDKNVVDSFVKYVSIYPLGSGVILSTRERGIVVKVNRELPTRPVVRVVYDDRLCRLADFVEVDLSEKRNIFIVDSCDI